MDAKMDCVLRIPQALVDRIIRTAEAKRESVSGNTQNSYREWENSGYSIYNDRG